MDEDDRKKLDNDSVEVQNDGNTETVVEPSSVNNKTSNTSHENSDLSPSVETNADNPLLNDKTIVASDPSTGSVEDADAETLSKYSSEDEESVDTEGYTGGIEQDAIPPLFIPNTKGKYKTFVAPSDDHVKLMNSVSFLCHVRDKVYNRKSSSTHDMSHAN